MKNENTKPVLVDIQARACIGAAPKIVNVKVMIGQRIFPCVYSSTRWTCQTLGVSEEIQNRIHDFLSTNEEVLKTLKGE